MGDAFEIVPMLNMLRGKIHDVAGRFEYAFPERYADFYFKFVKPRGAFVDAYRELFANRVRDMIMWYRVPRGLKDLPIPDIESETVIEVPMEGQQWESYVRVAAKEKDLEKKMRRHDEESIEGIPNIKEKGVFRSFTRREANFSYPLDFEGDEHKIDKISPDMLTLDKVKSYSIKIWAIATFIEEHPDAIHGVYSFFVGDYGITPFARVLDVLGWMSINDLPIVNIDQLVAYNDKHGTKKNKYYMVLTGKEDSKEKSRLIAIFNTKINVEKKLIGAVLYSSAGGHGFSLYSTRYVHFMESEWSLAETEQIFDRFARIGSAQYLPSDQRELIIRYYHATAPPDITMTTVDQDMRNIAIKSLARHIPIVRLATEISSNCREQLKAENELSAEYISKKEAPPLRTFFHCLTCTGKVEPNIYIQMSLPNECKETDENMPENLPSIDEEETTYYLDPSTGLGWSTLDEKIYTLINNSYKLRRLWRSYLEKPHPVGKLDQ